MKKPLRTLAPACGASLSRRSAVKQVGGWMIYLGTVTVAACGRTPLGDPLGDFIGDDDDDDAVTTLTPTPTATPTPEPCECVPFSGSSLGLNASALPVNAFAVNNGLKIFVCHDADGFYAMSDLCTHAGNHILDNGGSSFNTNNLGGGFRCGYHSSTFSGNGLRTGGPAPVGSFLTHYLLTIDGGGALYINQTVIVDPTCRCTP